MLEVGAFAEREKDLADVVLQVIVNSYMEKVQKWKGSERIMCEALRVLMADELNEERMEGQREVCSMSIDDIAIKSWDEYK